MRKFKLKTGDGKTFEAESPTQVVDVMRETNMMADPDDVEFMKMQASIFNSMHHMDIRYSSKKEFAEDLISIGVLEEITA